MVDMVDRIRVVSVSDPPIAWSIGLNDQVGDNPYGLWLNAS